MEVYMIEFVGPVGIRQIYAILHDQVNGRLRLTGAADFSRVHLEPIGTYHTEVIGSPLNAESTAMAVKIVQTALTEDENVAE